MKFDFENTVLVTHKGCMDGSGCALVFLHAGGKRENIRFVKAGMLEKFVKEEQELMASDKFLLIADLGFNDPSYIDVLQKRGSFLLVDHHVTSLAMAGQANIYARPDGCGSMLLAEVLEIAKREDFKDGTSFWKLNPWSMDQLVRRIDDFDRWILQDPHSDDVAVLTNFYGQERFVDLLSNRPDDGGDKYCFTEAEEDIITILKARRDESIADDMKRVKLKLVDGMTIVYAVTGNPNVSQLLHAMLQSFPQADIACQINLERDSTSLRSRADGPDVAKFCSQFKGGGHVHAAGHRLPAGLIDTIISEVHGG